MSECYANHDICHQKALRVLDYDWEILRMANQNNVWRFLDLILLKELFLFLRSFPNKHSFLTGMTRVIITLNLDTFDYLSRSCRILPLPIINKFFDINFQFSMISRNFFFYLHKVTSKILLHPFFQSTIYD